MSQKINSAIVFINCQFCQSYMAVEEEKYVHSQNICRVCCINIDIYGLPKICKKCGIQKAFGFTENDWCGQCKSFQYICKPANFCRSCDKFILHIDSDSSHCKKCALLIGNKICLDPQ